MGTPSKAQGAGPPGSPLDRHIYRHYSRSALIPILTIELLLVLIYFGVNTYTSRQTELTLRGDVTAVMPELVRKQADIVDQTFERVASETAHFARENERLFARPGDYRVAGEPPRFAVAPTGALYQVNRSSYTSLYYTHAARLKPGQLEKARFTAALDPLYRHLVQDVPNVVAAYLNTPDDMNRIYPFIHEVYRQYPADLRMREYNFFYLADEKHDPLRKPVWTGAYLDPAGQGWMVSCVAPVYASGRLQGVTGLDVTIDNIAKNILSQRFPWGGSAFLADGSGMILAMSPTAEGILGLKELKRHVYKEALRREKLKPENFNVLKNPDRSIAQAFSRAYASRETVEEFTTAGGERLFAVQHEISGTGWRLFVLIKTSEVLKSVDALARLSNRIGLALIALMLLFYVFFFLYLRRRAALMSAEIARPVSGIAAAAQALGDGAVRTEIPISGITELDGLAAAFARMSEQLEANAKALVEVQVRATVQAKEQELAFARGMFESASGYLHNVGNSITRLESLLLDLEEILKSTEQYPEVFDRIASGADPAVLKRFREVLLERTVPRFKRTVQEIERVNETMRQTIHHQQQTFKDAKAAMAPVSFDLAALVNEAAASLDFRAAGVELALDLPEKLQLTHHRNQIYNGVLNLLKNAVEASRHAPRPRVTVKLEAADGGARLTVADNGAGVKPENKGRLLSAGFTTKADGHGLGLHSFAVFLSAHGGRISLESPGPGLGATVTVEVNHV